MPKCSLITLGDIGALIGDILISGNLIAVGTVNLEGDFVFSGGTTSFVDATFSGTTTIIGTALNVSAPSNFTAPATFVSVGFTPSLVPPANPNSFWLNGNTLPPTLQFGATTFVSATSAIAPWELVQYLDELAGGGADPLLPPLVGTSTPIAGRAVEFYKVGRQVTAQFLEPIVTFGNSNIALIGTYGRILLSLTIPPGFVPPNDVSIAMHAMIVVGSINNYQPCSMRMFQGGGIEIAAFEDGGNLGFEVAANATPPISYSTESSVISFTYLVDP